MHKSTQNFRPNQFKQTQESTMPNWPIAGENKKHLKFSKTHH
jgi:hypothetical protein